MPEAENVAEEGKMQKPEGDLKLGIAHPAAHLWLCSKAGPVWEAVVGDHCGHPNKS